MYCGCLPILRRYDQRLVLSHWVVFIARIAIIPGIVIQLSIIISKMVPGDTTGPGGMEVQNPLDML
jgi:hypothetical protein